MLSCGGRPTSDTPLMGDVEENEGCEAERHQPAGDEHAIVIALDASEEAEHAVKWYLNKIHKAGNKIVFVHCIELPEMNLHQARSLHMSPGVLAEMWQKEEQKTKVLEAKMKDMLKEKGLKGVLRTATGRPGETIARIAEEESAEMVVVGMRGMGKVRRTILGSVSDYLVHHAHCPVVVCRHPDSILRQQMRRRHSSATSSEGSKSRHTSGDANRHRNISGEPPRNGDGDARMRVRKWSGDIFNKFTRSLSHNDQPPSEG